MDQMIKNQVEMLREAGYMCFICPECESALWLEGMPLMLMRLGVTHEQDCMTCIEFKERAVNGN